MLVGKPFVVAAYFLYDAVCAHAKRTLCIVIAQTSKREAHTKAVSKDETAGEGWECTVGGSCGCT